jgi:hypothetical protein
MDETCIRYRVERWARRSWVVRASVVGALACESPPEIEASASLDVLSSTASSMAAVKHGTAQTWESRVTRSR